MSCGSFGDKLCRSVRRPKVCVCVQEYGIFSAGDRDAGDAGESDRMDVPSEVHDPGGTGETDGMDELELCESSNIDLFAFTVCSFDPGVTETSRWAIPHVSLRLCQHHSSSSKRHTSCSAMTMTMTHSEIQPTSVSGLALQA